MRAGRLSVVVPTRDRPGFVDRCLDALQKQSVPIDEIIVVDQSRGDETAEVCADRESVRRLVDRGSGLSRAINIGVNSATGDLIAVVDDDCMADREWARELRAILDRYPEAVGACGAVLPGTNGAPDPDGIEISAINFERERLHRGRQPPYWVGLGGNFVMRAEIWNALGPKPCDERLGPGTSFSGANDMDLIYRLLRAGYPLASAPKMSVVHEQWRLPDAILTHMFRYSHASGGYAAKHLLTGDIYALVLIGRLFAADLKFVASGFKRRSTRRVLVGAARFAGTCHGLIDGRRLARGTW